MEIHVVSSYIQRFQKNFEKGLRCLYPMWVDFNDHMTTIARARNSVQTNSIDRKNRTHLRQWRPFPSCYHAILVINTICRLPMDWCGHGLQLLITNRHDGNGLAINMWNYLPPNVVLAILWLPNESLNLDAIPLARLGLVGSWRLECTLTRFVTWLLSSLEILESDHFRKWTSEIHLEEKHPVSWCKGKPWKTCDEIFWPTKFFLKPNPKSNEKSKLDLPKFSLGVHGLKGLFAFLRSKLFLQRITVFKPCTCALFLAALWWDGADSRGSSLCATETQQVWHYGTSAWRYPPRGHWPKKCRDLSKVKLRRKGHWSLITTKKAQEWEMMDSVFERSHFGHHYIFEFLNTTQPCSMKILLANDTYGTQITHNKRHAAIFAKVDIFLMYQVKQLLFSGISRNSSEFHDFLLLLNIPKVFLVLNAFFLLELTLCHYKIYLFLPVWNIKSCLLFFAS